VSVESADALEQYISRAQVRHEKIGIEIQRLLNGLRCHDDAPSVWSLPPEPRLEFMVEGDAIGSGETRVVGRPPAFAREEDVRAFPGLGEALQMLLCGDAVRDGVPDHQDLCGASCSGQSMLRD
jgi:hypothetical protein